MSSNSNSNRSMQGIQFERPIGAPADIKELEYIAALHQTNPEEIRRSGTVQAKDICNYLTSRHGVFVEPKTAQKRILEELCGTWMSDEAKKGDEEACMDICQMLTLLLIPYLRQEDIAEAKKPVNAMEHGMAQHVLNLILEELEGQGVDMSQFKAVDENFETGTRITSKLIQHMFDAYGEYYVPDDVLDEMVEQAALHNADGGTDGNNESFQKSQPILLKTRQKDDGPKVFWTKDSFQRALTADVQLYNPEWEDEQTTHLEDVRSVPQKKERAKGDRIKFEDDFYTAQNVDQGADQYRSVTWTLLLWVSFLFFYGCYMLESGFKVSFGSCSNVAWGCDAGAAIVNWLIVTAQLCIVGTLYVFLGSLGNSSHPAELGSEKATRAMGVLVAMGVVTSATIVPNFVEGEAFIWNSNKAEGYEVAYWICFSLGVLLVCLQFTRMVDIFVPLGALGAGGRTRSEQCTKQAATKKTRTMVENAMLLHVAPILAGQKPKAGAPARFPVRHASPTVVKLANQLHEENDKDKTTKKYRGVINMQTLTGGKGSGRALFNYEAMHDTTETTGGVLWVYKGMADGSIYDEEGIWFPARLMTSTIVQVLVVAMLVVAYFVILGEFEENKDTTVAVGSRRLMMMNNSLDWEHNPAFSDAGFMVSRGEQVRARQLHRDYQQMGLVRRHRRRRHLQQSISPVNGTHYTDGTGVYANIIFDVNRTHFSDGSNFWSHNTFSHNGTHVFDKYFRFNTTHFTDGDRYYPYAQYATNGTHITNGDYVFDGVTITQLSGNPAVNNVEQWEFEIALAFGLVVAVLAVVGISIVYIPSYVSTVLKFRSGVLESLQGGKQFQELRDRPDNVTTLLGSALWGAAFTGLFCWLFVGGIVFSSVWSETRETALQIYALLLGILAIFLLRFLVTKMFRDLYVSSFYRKHPAAMNIVNVVLECWNLALSIGTMLARAIKLSLVAFLYIGRIDVPVFSPGVGTIGPLRLDSEHVSFKKDLLIHEAHRHPYVERIGQMCLLKLHHGSEFGTRAGAYWRMLFSLALMPWMRSYRVSNRSKQEATGDGNEDGSEGSDAFEDEFASQDGDQSVMSLHGMDVELELTRRANDQLTRRNSDLKDALMDLRQRLRASNKNVAKLERKTGANVRSTSIMGLESVAMPSAPEVAISQHNDESSFESESEGPVGRLAMSKASASADEESFTSESGSGLV